MGTILVFFLIDLILEGIYGRLADQKITKILNGIVIILGYCLMLSPLRNNFFNYFPYFYFLIIFINTICIYVESSDNDVKICLQFLINFTFPLFFSQWNTKYILFGAALYCGLIIPSVFINHFNAIEATGNPNFLYENLPLLYHRSLYIIGTLALLVVYGYFEELASRMSFIKFFKKNSDHKKDDEIYANLVPQFVSKKMMDKESKAAIDYETVTMIFADISDFDKLVVMLKPKELIYLLDRIYSTFDQQCHFHGIQKIETVGKTYMAAGGLKEIENDLDPVFLTKNHAVRIYELALSMIDAMNRMTLENGEKVKIKIGIHTGKVLTAVVGDHKPQFSLIGDAVNTTARMCAYSSDLCILCSEPAYELIFPSYTDFQMSVKTVKGKGELKVFLHNPNKVITTSVHEPNLLISNQIGNVKNLLTKQPTLNRKNTMRRENTRNQSINDNFYDEDNCFADESEVSKVKQKKTLAKQVTQLVKVSDEGTNTIFADSFLFLNFKKESSKLNFDLHNQIELANNTKKNMILNFIFIAISAIGTFNFAEYYLLVSSDYIFVMSKLFILILFLILTINITKMKVNAKTTLRWFNFILLLLYMLVIQINLNFVEDYFVINLIMEMNLTTAIICYNSVLGYRNTFFSVLLFIVILTINCIINNSKPLIIKYLVLSIIISLSFLIFLIIRLYFSTLHYIRKKKESESLKKIEDLLFNLMPQHVVQNLKEDIPVADVIENVTLLYAGKIVILNI